MAKKGKTLQIQVNEYNCPHCGVIAYAPPLTELMCVHCLEEIRGKFEAVRQLPDIDYLTLPRLNDTGDQYFLPGLTAQ